MSYQGKKNIPRITVSLVLGKSAVGQQATFCGTENMKAFFKRRGRKKDPTFPPAPVAEEGDRGGGRRNNVELEGT